VEPRNASATVIGAGDYIGAAIAKRFAAEGFTVFAGRRNGEKLALLVSEIEAGGGRVVAWSLDERKEDEVTAVPRQHKLDSLERLRKRATVFEVKGTLTFPSPSTRGWEGDEKARLAVLQWRMLAPGSVGFENRVEDDQQLAHGGGERQLAWFTGVEQALIEGFEYGVVVNRNQGRHVQHGAHLAAPAPHHALPAQGTCGC
jgi:hypothetical protein